MGQSFYCSCLTKKIAYWKIIIFPCHVIFIMSWLLILMLSSIHLWGQASLQIMCCKILYVIQNLHCTLWKCLDEYQSSLDGIFHFKVCGMFCGQNGSTYKWCLSWFKCFYLIYIIIMVHFLLTCGGNLICRDLKQSSRFSHIRKNLTCTYLWFMHWHTKWEDFKSQILPEESCCVYFIYSTVMNFEKNLSTVLEKILHGTRNVFH